MISEYKDAYGERVSYQKSGEKSYLVLSSGEEPKIPYQINMIRYNQIPGLLPVQFFIEDGVYKYFYDISCKESIVKKLEHKKYTIKEIRTIMSSLYRCVRQLEEYLLDINCIILNPQYIFSDKEAFHIQFCFYADKEESFEESLEELFDYFLNRLDYQDERTVVLVYSLYQKSREEHTPLYEVMKQFCETADLHDQLKKEKEVEASSLSEDKSDEQKWDGTFPKRNRELNGKKQFGEKNSAFGSEKTIKGLRKSSDAEIQESSALKTLIERYLPYLPDLIGGYGIAKVIWYISKHHMEMSGGQFMMWMLVVAGILAGAGVVSTILSTYIKKKGQEQIDSKGSAEWSRMSRSENTELWERRADSKGQRTSKKSTQFEKNTQFEKTRNWENNIKSKKADPWKECTDFEKSADFEDGANFEEGIRLEKNTEFEQFGFWEEEAAEQSKREVVDKIDGFQGIAESSEVYEVRRKSQENSQEIAENESDESFLTKNEQDEDLSLSEDLSLNEDLLLGEDLLGEAITAETEDSKEKEKGIRTKKRYAVPATVVMSEPELFRAYNPVLISCDKERFQDVVLKERKMIVGKVHGIADIYLEGKSVSRVHARIIQDRKGCCVMDLGSTNGTYVNGIRLAERQKKYLQKGDEIRFAEAMYEYFPAESENIRSHSISEVI